MAIPLLLVGLWRARERNWEEKKTECQTEAREGGEEKKNRAPFFVGIEVLDSGCGFVRESGFRARRVSIEGVYFFLLGRGCPRAGLRLGCFDLSFDGGFAPKLINVTRNFDAGEDEEETEEPRKLDFDFFLEVAS